MAEKKKTTRKTERQRRDEAKRLAELSAGDDARPKLTILPPLEQLPDRMLDAGAQACFDAIAQEKVIDKRTIFKSINEHIEWLEGRVTKLRARRDTMTEAQAGMKEPMPKLIPYEEQPMYVQAAWRRLAQRVYKAMEKAK